MEHNYTTRAGVFSQILPEGPCRDQQDHSIPLNGTASIQTSHTHPDPTPRGTPLPRKGGHFVQVNDEVFERYFSTLTRAQILVYMWLSKHANRDNRCWPSVTRLAKVTGYSPRQVQRSLRDLEALGLVRCDPRDHAAGDLDTNFYTLLVPPSRQSQTSSAQNGHAEVVSEIHQVVSDRDQVVTPMSGGVVTPMSPGVVTWVSPELDPFNQIQEEPDPPHPRATRGPSPQGEGVCVQGNGKVSKGKAEEEASRESEDGEPCRQCGKVRCWDAEQLGRADCPLLALQRRLYATRAAAAAAPNGLAHGGGDHG